MLAALARPWFHLVASAGILALDLVTGRFLMFPILFVVPVTFAAWFTSARLAFTLAVVLPVARFFISAYVEHLFTPFFSAANALIRVAVLLFIAYLVSRAAKQTQKLVRDVRLLEGILHICMFCKRIRDEHEAWQPIEGYIAKRSEADFSHGLCPECAAEHYPGIFNKNRMD